ncbi:hypothetical protein BH23THE1_BH23THE1_30350 [soil metagenome]
MINGDSDFTANDNDVFSKERSSSRHQNSKNSDIELVQDKEVVKNKMLDFINNSNKQICICKDTKSPFLDNDESVLQAFRSFHGRGGMIKYITKVDQDNVSQCKKIMQFCNLRHLDSIDGNLATNDRGECITTTIFHDKDYNIIYSNSKEFHDKQQQVYEIYWNKAIDGLKKIKDLEEEEEKKRKEMTNQNKEKKQQDKTIVTQISSNKIDKATKVRLNQLIRNSRRIDICCNIEWINRIQQVVYGDILEMITTFADGNKKERLDTKLHYNDNNSNDVLTEDNNRKEEEEDDNNNNKHYSISNKSQINKIRWLSSITTENRQLVKKHLDKGIEIRNIEIVSINFIVSDIYCIFGIENFDLQQEGFQVFFSDDENYIKHYTELFKKLWKTGQNAIDTMKQNVELNEKVKRYYKEIQQTEESEASNDDNTISNVKDNQVKEQRKSDKKPEREITEIIYNSEEFAKRMLQLTEKTRHDIMLILASSNSFNLSLNFGAFDIFNRLVKERSTNIRILLSTPLSPESNVILDEQQKEKEAKEVDKIKNYIQNSMSEIKFELIDKKNYYKEAEGMSILLIDHTEVLAWEVNKNNTTDNIYYESTRLAIYSNSRPLVLSYNSIFESLWSGTQLYNDLKKANEKIAYKEKLEREFIDITAHELRTPVQTIMGSSEMALEALNQDHAQVNTRYNELFQRIIKNAYRINTLLEDFLNVTRLENNLLTLYKENINIYKIVQEVIRDFNDISNTTGRLDDKRKNIKINFEEPNFDTNLVINVDRTKIYQVLANLINNALRFSESNKEITVSINMMKKGEGEGRASEETKFFVVNDSNDSNKDYNNTSKNYTNNTYQDNKNTKSEKITKPTTKKGKTEVVINVKDRGKGIDTKIFPKLFEKFVTGSKYEAGLGLGLYISKRFVEMHGGEIWAQNNEDEGRGATFSFSLPLSNK